MWAWPEQTELADLIPRDLHWIVSFCIEFCDWFLFLVTKNFPFFPLQVSVCVLRPLTHCHAVCVNTNIYRFHCHATKKEIGNRPVEEAKKMKCCKRLIFKRFAQVSGLSFHSRTTIPAHKHIF